MNPRGDTKPTARAGSPAAIACVLLAGATLAGASPLRAADTTFERLANPEPQNWLTNHHDYRTAATPASSTSRPMKAAGRSRPTSAPM